MINRKEDWYSYLNSFEDLQEVLINKNIVSFQELNEELNGATRAKDFGNYGTKVSALNKHKGLIPTDLYLEHLRDCSERDLEAFEVEELFSQGYDFKIIEEDNSYNSNGYLGNHIEHKVIECLGADLFLLVISVHVGLDIRAGYSSTMVLKFDSKWDIEESMLYPRPTVVELDIEDTRGNIWTGNGTVSPYYESVDIYIVSEAGTIETEMFTSVVDLLDFKEELKENLENDLSTDFELKEVISINHVEVELSDLSI